MISSTTISLRSDDSIESLLNVEFDPPAEHIQRVHVHIGANTFNMSRKQFDNFVSLLMGKLTEQLTTEKFQAAVKRREFDTQQKCNICYDPNCQFPNQKH